METKLREHIADRKRQSVEGETKDRLFAALTEKFTFAVPESLVQEQIDARLERGLRALAAQGMNTEQMRKLDFARLRTAQRDSAIAEVKASILLDRISNEEKITVTDEELDPRGAGCGSPIQGAGRGIARTANRRRRSG